MRREYADIDKQYNAVVAVSAGSRRANQASTLAAPRRIDMSTHAGDSAPRL